MDGLLILWNETAIANFKFEQLIMIFVGCGLLFLAIRKGFEPLLLLPIGFGAVLANIRMQGLPILVDFCITFIMSGLKRESSHF